MTREKAYRLAMRACEETWNEKTCKQIKEALEQEPCDDAISRQAAIDVVSGIDRYFVKYIKELPSITPKQKTGHWIESRCDMYECSECGHTFTDLSCERYGMNYCPNCGCAMFEPQESEDKE